jgi:hypothetical protein
MIRDMYMPCPDTSCIGVDDTNNHIGFFLTGEAPTGYPSDFEWIWGTLFFGDPESRRSTPLYGFEVKTHEFIEGVFHRWWKILEESCLRRSQYWDARNYINAPDQWNEVVQQISALVSDGNTGS